MGEQGLSVLPRQALRVPARELPPPCPSGWPQRAAGGGTAPLPLSQRPPSVCLALRGRVREKAPAPVSSVCPQEQQRRGGRCRFSRRTWELQEPGSRAQDSWGGGLREGAWRRWESSLCAKEAESWGGRALRKAEGGGALRHPGPASKRGLFCGPHTSQPPPQLPACGGSERSVWWTHHSSGCCKSSVPGQDWLRTLLRTGSGRSGSPGRRGEELRSQMLEEDVSLPPTPSLPRQA